jgi:hypothetical protein
MRNIFLKLRKIIYINIEVRLLFISILLRTLIIDSLSRLLSATANLGGKIR